MEEPVVGSLKFRIDLIKVLIKVREHQNDAPLLLDQFIYMIKHYNVIWFSTIILRKLINP